MKYLIFLTILFFQCKQPSKTDTLTLIPQDQIIPLVKSGSFSYLYATFLNQDGSAISDKNRELLNSGKLGKDYYKDSEGVIKEVRVRPITNQDKFIEIQRIEIASNPLSRINLIDIDCSQLDLVYERVYQSDQNVRNEGGDMQSVDEENLQIVISALTKCGWSVEHLETIWLVFQHSDSDIMAYFYSDLKSFSDQGLLRKSSFALTEDRLLMYHGYKQIYGSQITNGGLYDLQDPSTVNERRAEMGLGTIEDYIDHWGLNFSEEKERMASNE